MVDGLDKLIAFAQISGSINVLCRFQGQWSVHHRQRRGHGTVHFVTEGSGWLKIGTEPAKLVQKGDLIVLPHSAEHILSHHHLCDVHANKHVVYERQGVFTIKTSGVGEPELSLFCADFSYEAYADLFRGLPDVLFLDGNSAEFCHLLGLLKNEAAEPLAASSHIIDALLQILLVLILRRYLSDHSQPKLFGVLNGLQDKRLRQVMMEVLNQPAEDWTVERMAQQAHISRAQLMRLFKHYVGMGPHAFLNRIRLQEAALLLRKSTDSVLKIALSVGFQSETNFGKSFKKEFGLAPGAYRKYKTDDGESA